MRIIGLVSGAERDGSLLVVTNDHTYIMRGINSHGFPVEALGKADFESSYLKRITDFTDDCLPYLTGTVYFQGQDSIAFTF